MKALAEQVRLRHDGRRLGLEGAFSGVALGLVLLFLLQEGAAAQGFGPRSQSPGGPPEAEPIPGGMGAASGWGRRRPAEGQRQAEVAAPLAPLPPLVNGPDAVSGVGGGLGVAPVQPLRAALQPFGIGVPLVGVALGQPSWGGAAAWADPSTPAGPAAALLPPALLVWLRSHDTLVASSVDGAAALVRRGSQVAIDDAWLDLRASPLPLVRVVSDHTLSALGRSTLGSASLLLDLQHQGLRNSTLLLGLGESFTELAVSEWLQLAPLAGAGAATALQVDLATLQGSQVLDFGGDGLLSLLAHTNLLLPQGADSSGWEVALRNRAMADSTLELLGGDQRVEIRSTIGIDGPVDPRWQLQALALEGSQLRTGSGNDTVLIDGDIVASWFDLGSGVNSAQLHGAVQDSTLHLSGDSRTQMQLSDQNDGLRLSAGPGLWSLELRAGGGDDSLWLPVVPRGSSLTLWGGSGRDRFVLPQNASGGGTVVLADLQGTLTADGLALSDDLLWSNHGDGLIPSGLEGLGQARLLPIAPLEQLLAGIGAAAAGPAPGSLNPQLAIAAGTTGSQLLWLDPATAAAPTLVASLPGLHWG